MNTARSTAFLNGKEATVNRKYDYILYDYLDWIKIRRQVNKLQSRIAKAVKNNKIALAKERDKIIKEARHGKR